MDVQYSCDIINSLLTAHGVLLGVCGIYNCIETVARHHNVRLSTLHTALSRVIPRRFNLHQTQGQPPVLPITASIALIIPHGLALAIITAKLLDIVHHAWVPVHVLVPVLAALFGWLAGAGVTVALVIINAKNRHLIQRYWPTLNASGMLLASLWILGLLQAALMINEHSCAWQGGDGIVVRVMGIPWLYVPIHEYETTMCMHFPSHTHRYGHQQYSAAVVSSPSSSSSSPMPPPPPTPTTPVHTTTTCTQGSSQTPTTHMDCTTTMIITVMFPLSTHHLPVDLHSMHRGGLVRCLGGCTH